LRLPVNTAAADLIWLCQPTVFTNGKIFSGVKGGQRAAAQLLGCSQSTVSKRSGVDISPIKSQKRRKRRDTLAPAVVTAIMNYWVMRLLKFVAMNM